MARESREQKKTRARRIVAALKNLYPDARCSLNHENPLQLLIATMLSAQCTDARVNLTTPALFAKYKTAGDFAIAKPTDLENLVRSTGFYKNKAKNIKAMAQRLVDVHSGRVPRTIEDLSALPGVGRKTANVVLGVVYGVPSMVVDTHVIRLSNRMGLVKNADPVKLEHALMEIIDKKDWIIFTHLIISHGRAVCMARSPKCKECALAKMCPKLI